MEIKTARNWYWWLWLSPIFTLPTYFFIMFESFFYDTTPPEQIVSGVLYSSIWHLILIIPASSTSSRFVRWHGLQTLILAGIQTALALLIGYFPAPPTYGFLIIGLIAFWFIGNLVFQLEAGRGYCTLWRWFGNKDQPLLKGLTGEIPDWQEGEGPQESEAYSPAVDQTSASTDFQAELAPPPDMDGLTDRPAKSGQGINPLAWIGTGVVLLVLISFLCLVINLPRMIDNSQGSTNTPLSTPLPNTLTPEQSQRKQAAALVKQIDSLSYHGNIVTALWYLERAQQLNPDVYVSSDTWNNLCWFGSLYGYPQEVYQACENAIAMWSGHGGYRDSRGLARALLGDFEGAIEDFEAFINMAGVNPLHADKRRSWIEDLEQGINPFDEETLEELKNE